MNADQNKREEHHQSKALKKIWKQKIKDIESSLDRGGDINAVDNNCNTLLHTAVLNAEVDVVKCLLNKKANVTIKNCDNQTALDIAELLEGGNGKQIVSLLRIYQNGNFCPSRKRNNSINQQNKTTPKVTMSKQPYYYQKRTGTSGIHGQLYETKLLSLILFRALHDSDIEDFYLGTNITGLGAFDDVVFRYKKHGDEHVPKILFMQAKHKDDPEKDKVTFEDALNENGNFGLHKYLESYMDVIQKFCSDYKNEMFQGPFKTLNCEFIIYTPAVNYLNEDKVLQRTDEESYIKTSESGKVFQFHADDTVIEKLAPTVKKALAKQIAVRLSNFINQKTDIKMTAGDVLNVYHVYLAQNVLESRQDQDNNSTNEVRFRKTFLETKDENLLVMKNTICKELRVLKGKPVAEIEEKLQSLSFTVPESFGNVKYLIKGTDKKKEETLQHLSNIFKKLFIDAHEKNYIIEIKESDIVSEKCLLPTNTWSINTLELHKISDLVGNLLIFDQETKMLKFNLDEDHLTDDGLRLLKLLQNDNNNVSRYRFDVQIPWFPKLVLSKDEDDINLVREFLKKLKFYTNQAKEDEVEVFLKNEIDIKCNSKHNDKIFRAKTDAVYLKFHDEVQKWWKQLGWTEYLTKTCKYFHEANRETLDSPLLRILNYTCKNKLKTYETKFKPGAIKSLKITDFLEDNHAKILVFISNEIVLTSIKLFQYFGESDKHCDTHTFLDLECAIRDKYVEIIEKELKGTKCRVIVLIYETDNASKFQVSFDTTKNAFHGKIILITSAYVSDKLKDEISDNIVQRIDTNTTFIDLEDETKKNILIKRELAFQGQNISVNSVLNAEFLCSVKPKTIFRFINRETITVGEMSTVTNLNKKKVDFYINRSLCRHVALSKDKNADLYLLNTVDSDDVSEDAMPQDNCDIVLITEHVKYFENTCEENKNRNVHLFKREISDKNNIILLKSQGQLSIEDENKGIKAIYQVMPETVKDIEDRIVIIRGEPGMGKSTLLSHLAVHTKQKYPTLWVSKISFDEHLDQFERWKDYKSSIDLVEAFKFLYDAIDIRAFKKEAEADKNILEKIGKRIVVKNVNEIYLNNNNIDETVELFEIDVFNHCYNNNRVVLLFDGFDEICSDYENEAIKLLSTLKSSKVAHIWVTTRPYNIVKRLQCALGTISFVIKPLNRVEQSQYLQKIWMENLGYDKETSLVVGHYARLFLLKIIKKLGDETFAGSPLHISLIADYYQENFGAYLTKDMADYVLRRAFESDRVDTTQPSFQVHCLPSYVINFNLCALYETCIKNIFFKIRYGTIVTSSTCLKDKKMVEKLYKDFLEIHKKISAYILFDKSIVMELFCEKDLQDIHNLIEAIKSGDEKSGIIECIIGDRPKFVHLTYCEYFATEFICYKLKSDSFYKSFNPFWEYLITDIFVSENKRGIRRFIDSKLKKSDLFKETFLYKDYSIISYRILDIILSPKQLPTLFEVTLREGVCCIAYLILRYVTPAINKYNLERFLNLFQKTYISIPKSLCLICAHVGGESIFVTMIHEQLSILFQIDFPYIMDILVCPILKRYFVKSPFLLSSYRPENE